MKGRRKAAQQMRRYQEGRRVDISVAAWQLRGLDGWMAGWLSAQRDVAALVWSIYPVSSVAEVVLNPGSAHVQWLDEGGSTAHPSMRWTDIGIRVQTSDETFTFRLDRHDRQLAIVIFNKLHPRSKQQPGPDRSGIAAICSRWAARHRGLGAAHGRIQLRQSGHGQSRYQSPPRPQSHPPTS